MRFPRLSTNVNEPQDEPHSVGGLGIALQIVFFVPVPFSQCLSQLPHVLHFSSPEPFRFFTLAAIGSPFCCPEPGYDRAA